MADSREEKGLIVFGTPMEDTDELSQRNKKRAIEDGRAKNLPVWKQEVTDEEGRRRFHGAFTGGFSAGYYNTVGSKEGWTPATFVSSRKSRVEKQKPSTAYDFMDDDEKTEMDSNAIFSAADFDTFGGTAAELAKRQLAESDWAKRESASFALPEDILLPTFQSLGTRLLIKMGWRPGKKVDSSALAATQKAIREGRKAFLGLSSSEPGPDSTSKKVYGAALPPEAQAEERDAEDGSAVEALPSFGVDSASSVPSFILQPKKDLYGLGFNPLVDAPEFQAAKLKQGAPPPKKVSSGFGIGALEEAGQEDDDVYFQGEAAAVREVMEEEDEQPGSDTQRRGPSGRLALTQGRAVPAREPLLLTRGGAGGGNQQHDDAESIPGFHLGSSLHQLHTKTYPPPHVPAGFNPVHKFSPQQSPLSPSAQQGLPLPAAPSDALLRSAIEGLSALVARGGPAMEQLARERHAGDRGRGSAEGADAPPVSFEFLWGGEGHEYYSACVRQAREKLQGQQGVQEQQRAKMRPRLAAEERGRLLGEVPLAALPAAAVPAPPLPARESPYQGNPEKQARFEAYLQTQVTGGIRPRADRAPGGGRVAAGELAEFETAAAWMKSSGDAPAKPSGPAMGTAHSELAAIVGSRFTKGGVFEGGKEVPLKVEGAASEAVAVARWEERWRPSPLLCRRLNVPDPFPGEPFMAGKPKPKSDGGFAMPGMDMPGSKGSRWERGEVQVAGLSAGHGRGQEGEAGGAGRGEQGREDSEVVVSMENKPMDLFKAIFSDEEESGGEEREEASKEGKGGSESASVEAIAAAALRKLEAADFLEALGMNVDDDGAAAGDRGEDLRERLGIVETRQQGGLQAQKSGEEGSRAAAAESEQGNGDVGVEGPAVGRPELESEGVSAGKRKGEGGDASEGDSEERRKQRRRERKERREKEDRESRRKRKEECRKRRKERKKKKEKSSRHGPRDKSRKSKPRHSSSSSESSE